MCYGRRASMNARSAAPLTALLFVCVSGCGGDDPPAPLTPGRPLRLLAEPESVAIQPSQSKDVVFRLVTESDVPVPGRVIQFSIVDDPATPAYDSGGATLSFDRGVTGAEGTVSLQIIAGPQATMFRVRASAPRAPEVEVVVLVTTATHAPVELVPALVDPPEPGREVTTVRLYLLDDGACAQVDYDQLPSGTLFARTIPSDSTALFSTVDTGKRHQVVAVGLDGGGVARAGGCVDLPGALLLVDVPLRLVIPMHLFRLGVEGRFEVTSRLPLRPTLKSASVAAEAWRELGLCPLDPARLWLDCTIDALQTSEADPSDCRPAADEGTLGALLTARRGVPLAMPGQGACRDGVDGSGRDSLDHLAARLFPVPLPRLADELPALATEVSRLLETVDLRSTLTILPASIPGEYQLEHRLLAVAFPLGAPIELLELGAPALEARFVPAMTLPEAGLGIGTHGFTLRLGSVARLAFGRSSLVARGAPPGAAVDLGVFVGALFAAAARDDGGTSLSGCGALDALLCADAGSPRGCLATACTEGLAALRRRLDAGFVAMDGDDLDFVLGGTVPLVDADGDRRADALGAPSGDEGLWSGEVRGRGGSSLLTGTWTAVKSGP